MLAETDTEYAPWTVVRSNDRRRTRLEIIRHVLRKLDYAGKNANVVVDPDPEIIGRGSQFIAGAQGGRCASAPEGTLPAHTQSFAIGDSHFLPILLYTPRP